MEVTAPAEAEDIAVGGSVDTPGAAEGTEVAGTVEDIVATLETI